MAWWLGDRVWYRFLIMSLTCTVLDDFFSEVWWLWDKFREEKLESINTRKISSNNFFLEFQVGLDRWLFIVSMFFSDYRHFNKLLTNAILICYLALASSVDQGDRGGCFSNMLWWFFFMLCHVVSMTMMSFGQISSRIGL